MGPGTGLLTLTEADIENSKGGGGGTGPDGGEGMLDIRARGVEAAKSGGGGGHVNGAIPGAGSGMVAILAESFPRESATACVYGTEVTNDLLDSEDDDDEDDKSRLISEEEELPDRLLPLRLLRPLCMAIEAVITLLSISKPCLFSVQSE